MKMSRLVRGVGAVLAVQVLAAASANAGIIAFTENAPPDSTPAATGLVGFEFTLNQNINLTQLGFYAQSIGGNDTPHVALLNVTAGQKNPPTVLYDTGNLNSAAVNPGGLVNFAINYVSVGTPIPLTVGQSYEITAPIYFSQQFNSTAGFTLGGAIATAAFEKGGGWNGWDPGNGVPSQVYDYTAQSAGSPGGNISADFQYTLAAVPEPGSIAVLAAVGAGLSMRRRKT